MQTREIEIVLLEKAIIGDSGTKSVSISSRASFVPRVVLSFVVNGEEDIEMVSECCFSRSPFQV